MKRIKLSRAKGWRMPPNTVKVDRSTPWGNPFIVGECGNKAEDCVRLFRYLCAGNLCISIRGERIDRQRAFRAHAKIHIGELIGHDLACWCHEGKPCHADVLLECVEHAMNTRIFVDASVSHPTPRDAQTRRAGARHGQSWCHLWSRDLDKLHALAKSIGLKREWFQNHRLMPHYDLTPPRRKAALEAGAIECQTIDWLRHKSEI